MGLHLLVPNHHLLNLKMLTNDSNVTTALISLGLPKHYGWVALAASSTYFLNIYQMFNVSRARKAAKVPYPQTYCFDKDNKAGNV